MKATAAAVWSARSSPRMSSTFSTSACCRALATVRSTHRRRGWSAAGPTSACARRGRAPLSTARGGRTRGGRTRSSRRSAGRLVLELVDQRRREPHSPRKAHARSPPSRRPARREVLAPPHGQLVGGPCARRRRGRRGGGRAAGCRWGRRPSSPRPPPAATARARCARVDGRSARAAARAAAPHGRRAGLSPVDGPKRSSSHLSSKASSGPAAGGRSCRARRARRARLEGGALAAAAAAAAVAGGDRRLCGLRLPPRTRRERRPTECSLTEKLVEEVVVERVRLVDELVRWIHHRALIGSGVAKRLIREVDPRRGAAATLAQPMRHSWQPPSRNEFGFSRSSSAFPRAPKAVLLACSRRSGYAIASISSGSRAGAHDRRPCEDAIGAAPGAALRHHVQRHRRRRAEAVWPRDSASPSTKSGELLSLRVGSLSFPLPPPSSVEGAPVTAGALLEWKAAGSHRLPMIVDDGRVFPRPTTWTTAQAPSPICQRGPRRRHFHPSPHRAGHPGAMASAERRG